MELELVGAPQSSFVRTVRMACVEKNVPYTLIPAMPHSSEVTAIHPLGRIPVMRHGDVHLFESRAIAGYVDNVFPGPRLFPEDPVTAARVEQWVSACNANILPTLNQFLQCFFFSGAPDGSPDEPGMIARLPGVKALVSVLNRAVEQNGHLADVEFTYADINLLPVLAYLSEVPASAEIVAESASLTDYLSRLRLRSSFVLTIPPAFSALSG